MWCLECGVLAVVILMFLLLSSRWNFVRKHLVTIIWFHIRYFGGNDFVCGSWLLELLAFLVRNPEFSPANNWIFKWKPSQEKAREKEFYFKINHFVYWHWINKNNMNCAYPSRVGLVISFWNIHKIWLVQISEFQLLNKPKRKE